MITGVVDTGEHFITGDNDTGNNFVAGDNDTGDTIVAGDNWHWWMKKLEVENLVSDSL